jgi:hypothetical protein
MVRRVKQEAEERWGTTSDKPALVADKPEGGEMSRDATREYLVKVGDLKGMRTEGPRTARRRSRSMRSFATS